MINNNKKKSRKIISLSSDISNSSSNMPILNNYNYDYSQETLISMKNRYKTKHSYKKTFTSLRKNTTVDLFHKNTLRSSISGTISNASSYRNNLHTISTINNNHNKKFSSFSSSSSMVPQTKIYFEIMNLYNNYYLDIFNYNKVCKSFSKIKTILQDRKKQYKIENDKINSYRKSIDNIVCKNKDKYNHLVYKIIPSLDNYLFFLKTKLKEEQRLSELLKAKKIKIQMITHKLQREIHEKIKDKKRCLECRNFLIKVKEHVYSLPEEFDINKSICIEDINIQEPQKKNIIPPPTTKNSMKTIKFNESLNFKKGISSPISIRKTSMFFLNNLYYPYGFNQNNYCSHNKFEKYLEPSYIIFQSVEQLEYKIKSYETINLKLNQKYNNILYEKRQLQLEYEEMKQISLNLEKIVNDDINKATIKHLELIKRNESLKYQMSLLTKNNHYNTSQLYKEISSFETIRNSSVNMALMRFKHYVNEYQLKSFYGYICYYISLIGNNIINEYQNIFKETNEREVYLKHIDILAQPDKYENEHARKICIEVLHFIEKCVYILYKKHQQYLSNKKNRRLIMEISMGKNTLKKVENNRAQRILLMNIRKKKLEEVEAKYESIVFKRNMKNTFYKPIQTIKSQKTECCNNDKLNNFEYINY